MTENEKNYYFWNEAEFADAVRKRICPKCVDFGEDGACHTRDPRGCALFRYLPDLVMIAQRLKEPKLEPYIRAVRENICMTCENSVPEGKCPLRDSLDCGLDRYLGLILEALEEENAILEKRGGFENER